MSGVARRIAPALLFFVTLLIARPCAAHPVGISRGEYRPTAAGLAVEMSFSEREMAPLFGPGREPAELIERIAVSAGGEPCAGRVRGAERVDPDGLHFVLSFECREKDARQVDLSALLRGLPHGHRHEARGGANASALLFDGQSAFEVGAPPPGAPFHAAVAFLHMGVEHVLTGYDHLVFLLGLVVVGLGVRRTLLVASAFTVAHSLTLALAVLGVWSPPSGLVEPAIALSIVYVGVENLRKRPPRHRVTLAFLFGLVHGFGFAGALGEVSFEGAGLVLALASFNAGVELGQLAALCVVFPLVQHVVLHPRLKNRAVPAVSVAVALSGTVWFASRILSA
ncbi:MAG TPA: HupE/UreJ family protein [Polyangiaceae bacterium]